MMRIDAWYLASARLDMRAGMDTLLARVIEVFGSAQPHSAYALPTCVPAASGLQQRHSQCLKG